MRLGREGWRQVIIHLAQVNMARPTSERLPNVISSLGSNVTQMCVVAVGGAEDILADLSRTF